MSKYCSVCGSTWDGYAVGIDQHYCRDGQRKTQPSQTESQRIEEYLREANDPWRANEEAKAAWRLRHRV